MGDDKAIWASWYDIDKADKDRYLDWLHGTFLPFLEKEPNFLWVAHYRDIGGGTPLNEDGKPLIGFAEDAPASGSQYLLIVAGKTTEAFLDPSVRALEKEWDRKFGGMLSLRRGLRSELLLEEKRVGGPAEPEGGYGLKPSPAIMFGTFRLPTPDHEYEMGSWYLKVRLPMMQETPGCIRVRKLVGVAGWAKYGAFYEFESDEDRQRWKAINVLTVRDPNHWTSKVIPSTRHAPGSPTIGIRTWPAV